MKKITKRILCSALSVAMASSLAAEYVLRSSADAIGAVNGTTATQNVKIENVTGQFDTSKLVESNFNSSVLKNEDVAPKYETRTVVVTLKGETVTDLAGDESVPEYLRSWSGQRAVANITSEQDTFLRKLKKTGIEYKLEKRYDTVLNGVAIEVNTKHVKAIKQIEGVDSVVITTSYSEPEAITTKATNVVENKTDVYDTGIYDSTGYSHYGAGMVVAILDTGLDYTHPAFQSFQSEDVKVSWTEADVAKKLADESLVAETRSGSLTAADVYVSEKVPYAYDYADDDPDVYPSYSNHGTHVAGIVGGYSEAGYTDKDGNPINETFLGVVPDAQLAIFKVFTDDLDDPDLGGAVAEDIIAALDDCVTLGVDVINMSLGTSCGFSTTDDGDDEGEMLNRVYNRIQEAGITLVAAASNDYSSGYGGTFGTNLASNPDSSTVGSPSTFAASLSVASINGQKADYLIANEADEGNKTFVFYEESRDIDGNPFDFTADLAVAHPQLNGEYEYVVVPGIGQAADYTSTIKSLFQEKGRIALIKRGDTTFQEKVEIAMRMGAIGVIIYNNVAGVIRMNLGEIDDPIPAVSINMNAGNALVKGAKNRIGTIKLSEEQKAGPFMSEFSSWGPTHDLKLKPEITAHGGEITSTVPGGYGEQSGTSMASPNMAGFMTIVRGYIEEELGITDAKEINRLAMQLTMSTAGTVYDPDGLPYSPRKQGAGVAKMENVVGGTSAYLWTDNSENDYRPKIEFGDDKEKVGEYTLTFKITNFGKSGLTFKPNHEFMTETLASDGLAVSEQAYILDDNAALWKVNGNEVTNTITVAAGETSEISVKVSLSEKEKAYIDKSFKNGMYVEGFLKLTSATEGQCDLSIPFLGFYGDWKAAPMLDYSAFEVAASEQDASIKEEDKIQASVWATLPYTSYYNEKYILPMGGYVYLLPDDEEPMYVDEDHCSVSRYNEYYGEGNTENYLTSTGIKALYAGLLRNARVVTYSMYNVATGEALFEGKEIYRVGKAYTAGGGGGVPANVELELSPEEYNLAANGQYRIDFEFYMEEEDMGQPVAEENTFSFTFTVDYEAPIVEDARVRYYNYKDGNKEKQRIYLDVDVYDNHYAQALMLCYPTENAQGETVLQIATDYPTPIRDAKKNGTTTVSIEITDLYDHICSEYGNQIYIQVDDYSINSCLYRIQLNEANAGMLPEGDDFALAAGEENVSLDIYQTHKVSVVYGEAYKGEGDVSNFLWTSKNPGIAGVKNGEIVGLSEGTTQIVVSNRKGVSRTINVTVSGERSSKLAEVPSISLSVLKTNYDALSKAQGTVKVNAGKEFDLEVITDPWYHPMENLIVKWETSNEAVATVDQDGVVKTLKKGTAIVTATIYKQLSNGKEEKTLYSATVILKVQNEFTVSNSTLTDYNGVGGVVTIPTDMNIWYIGAEAFKDNDNITKIIIPASVLQINERAFENCSALEEVYFVSEEHREGVNGEINSEIDYADVSMIYEQAFYNCKKLRKIDFSNAKTVTVAMDCFAGCTSLEEVVDMPSIGTMHHRAFQGCTSLKSVDLTGLHMSGNYVFDGCTSLAEIKTGKFTAIGNYMFNGCTGLRKTVTIKTPKIGQGAFANCVNLKGVKFDNEGDETRKFDIGARAFTSCGANLVGNFTVDFGGVIVRSIGERAFANSTLGGNISVNGLETLGANAFVGTYVESVAGVPFEGIEVTITLNDYTQDGSAIYSKDMKKLLYVDKNVSSFTIPDGVTEIGANAFKDSKLSAIHIPDSVVTIGANGFANSAIREVTGGDGLQEIGDNAFAGCIALQSITLPDGVKTMGNYVFMDCSNLKEVTLPSVEKLGAYTFYGANNLEKVTFGANATTTGMYTFAATSVKEVELGARTTFVDVGAFYQARNLQKIVLPVDVTEIKDNAFADCTRLSTVEGLDKVVAIGNYAFQNTAFTALALDSAERIGNGAFAINGGRNNAAYTSIEMPVVKTIGSLAFYQSGVASVTIPASVVSIGDGAFAASKNLTNITVAENNANFFAEDNVLYRYINKEAGEYELVCYPAAKTSENGYAIKEGTLRVQGYAFYGLKDEALNKVTLPYSVNAIGDRAFFDSGVTEYTFESIQAPVLEVSYDATVVERIEATATATTAAYYKGYYYSNFDTEIFDYTKFGGKTSELVMHYPSNGVGYDNHVYKLYFGSRNTLGILMEDNTRECIALVNGMPAADEVKGWNSWAVNAENKAKVEAFSETVKAARLHYNNISKNANQFTFISKEVESKLFAVESELRGVKKHFGIVSKISALELSADSAHKKNYTVGETFDMTGLVVTVVYDDYSTATADMSKVTLKDTAELTKYDRYVTVNYEGKSLRVAVTVTEPGEGNTSNNSSEKENGGNAGWIVGVVVVLALAGAGVAVYFLVIKKKLDAKKSSEEPVVETQNETETDNQSESDEK